MPCPSLYRRDCMKEKCFMWHKGEKPAVAAQDLRNSSSNISDLKSNPKRYNMRNLKQKKSYVRVKRQQRGLCSPPNKKGSATQLSPNQQWSSQEDADDGKQENEEKSSLVNSDAIDWDSKKTVRYVNEKEAVRNGNLEEIIIENLSQETCDLTQENELESLMIKDLEWRERYKKLVATQGQPPIETCKSGLVNFGTTCYINAPVQCLFSIIPLINALSDKADQVPTQSI